MHPWRIPIPVPLNLGIVWEPIRKRARTQLLSGNLRPQSSQLAEPLLTDRGIKSGISVCQLMVKPSPKKTLKQGKSHHHHWICNYDCNSHLHFSCQRKCLNFLILWTSANRTSTHWRCQVILPTKSCICIIIGNQVICIIIIPLLWKVHHMRGWTNFSIP